MSGHLILVVHGIGEQHPGETVDSVLAGAVADHQRQADPTPFETRSDVLDLPEAPFPPANRGSDRSRWYRPLTNWRLRKTEKRTRHAQPFPVHLRHIGAARSGRHDTTMAEVFWADRSPAPKGVVLTVIDLLRTFLGTGYLAMENARATGTQLSYGVVVLFCWLFYAGIAALNAHLLIGVLIMLGEGWLFELGPARGIWPFACIGQAGVCRASAYQLLITAGGLTLLAGYLTERFIARSQLVAQFARGLMFFGACSFLFLVVSLINPEAFGAQDVDPMVTYLGRYVAAIVFLIGKMWWLALALCALLYVLWFIDARSQDPLPGDMGQRRLYAPICSALVLLWMVSISSFWTTLEVGVSRTAVFQGGAAEADMMEPQPDPPTDIPARTADCKPPDPADVPSHQDIVPGQVEAPEIGQAEVPSVLCRLFKVDLAAELGGMTVAVICFGILLSTAVLLLIRRVGARHKLGEPRFRHLRRLLLNRWLQGAFAASTVLIIAAIALPYLKPDEAARGPVITLLDALHGYEDQSSTLLLALAFAFYYFLPPVSSALGIMRDITGYATTDRYVPWEASQHEIFSNRDAIEARFSRVLDLTIKAQNPDRLTIISHSLGTVVATRVLGKRAEANGADDLPADTTLVTMGSPVTHIYRKYFPRNFEVADVLLSDRINWVNIYRSDDFVGTRITGFGDRVRNCAVGAGGHSGYFTDAEVWEHLREEAGVTLLARP